METGAVTVHKVLSLVSLIPRWSGSDSTISLEEFFSNIESSAKIGNWKQTGQLQIAILKLSGGAKTFYQGCAELHTEETNWQTFNPLKPELNPICYLLALLAHHFLHVSRIRVKSLTLR